jgi:predicted MFS family arabinose efflux permease
VYESTSTAWVAGASPYETRAAWLGRLDVAWAGGLLVGVPVVAVLSLWTWRAAYVAIAALAFVAWWPVRRRVSAVHRPVLHLATRPARWEWSTVRRGLWIFAAFGLLAGASQSVVVVYGVWLEDRFGFPTSAIGAVGFLFGVGDLVATMATMRFTDRIGKVRSATFGALVLTVAALALTVTGHHAATGVVTLLVLLMGYEFALLSTKPVLTEVDPSNRGLGIGIGFGAAAACRGVAAIGGTAAYSAFGLHAAALGSAAAGGLALTILVRGGRRVR